MLDVKCNFPKTTNMFDLITYPIPTPLWTRVAQAQIVHYQYNILHCYLSNIDITHCYIIIFPCTISSHTSELYRVYKTIIDTCVFDTNDVKHCRNLSMSGE